MAGLTKLALCGVIDITCQYFPNLVRVNTNTKHELNLGNKVAKIHVKKAMAIPTSNLAKVADWAFTKTDADPLKSLKTSRSDLTELNNLVSRKVVQKPDYSYNFTVILYTFYSIQYTFLTFEEKVDVFT